MSISRHPLPCWPRWVFALAIGITVGPSSLFSADGTFDRDVLPILQKHCQHCHGGANPKHGLDVTTHRGLLKGGAKGPAVKAGSLKDSLLWTYIATDKMPSDGKFLTDDQKQVLQSWLMAGVPESKPFALLGSSANKTKTTKPAVKRGVQELAKAIDTEIDRKLRDTKLAAAPASDDAEFLRRVYLDITGRIPTAKQAAEFLASQEANKRARLIDELLASPNHGEQFGRVWRDWIAPAELPSEGNGGNQPIKATLDLGRWMGERFNKAEGWDAIVRKILTVEGTLKEQPQGIFFSLVGDDTGKPQPAGAARAIGTLFMGVNFQCAQCHNDPFKEWKQADFWGTAAFFRNMKWRFGGRYFEFITETGEIGDPKNNNNRANGKINDPSPVGKITIPKDAFKNVGKVIPAKFVLGDHVAAQEKQALRPVFTDWLVSRENPYFARSFVNRTWAYFHGRGIVHPIDDFRDENPPTHPELLDQLTAEFIAADFDVKHLVRCVTNSKTYQRTSRPAKGSDSEATKASVAVFARMPIKVMSADMLYDSLRLALKDPTLDMRGYDAKDANRFGESSPVGDAYGEFSRLFATNKEDATDFTHGIPQFLALINHPRISSGGKIVDEMAKANLDAEKAIEMLYLGTLSRQPSPMELTDAREFMSKAAEARRGYSGVLWTLLNRGEFLLVR